MNGETMAIEVSRERLLRAADLITDGAAIDTTQVAALMKAVAQTHYHYPDCICAEKVAANALAEAILEAFDD